MRLSSFFCRQKWQKKAPAFETAGQSDGVSALILAMRTMFRRGTVFCRIRRRQSHKAAKTVVSTAHKIAPNQARGLNPARLFTMMTS